MGAIVRTFLATGGRYLQKARDQIHRSLELRVDQVDLLQLHNLVEPREWEVALGPGGALGKQPSRRASKVLVRFIGVTGHGATIARAQAAQSGCFDFDSVLLPCSTSCRILGLRRFKTLMALCRERDVAVQTIKSIAHGRQATHTPRGTSHWKTRLTGQCTGC